MPLRLKPLVPGELEKQAMSLYQAVTDSPRAQGPGRQILIREDGSLVGPFDAWLRSPIIGLLAEQLGMAFREASALSDRQRELVVLTVAAHWQVDFEFQVHAMVARRAGLTDDIIHALAAGKTPAFADEPDLEVIYQLCRELLTSKQVTNDTYKKAISLTSEQEVIDVVSLLGFYQLVSGMLVTFEPPPPSVQIAAPGLAGGAA